MDKIQYSSGLKRETASIMDEFRYSKQNAGGFLSASFALSAQPVFWMKFVKYAKYAKYAKYSKYAKYAKALPILVEAR